MHGSYFTFDYVVTDLLFKGLSVSSVGGLIGLCLGVAAFTFMYESVKFFRRHLAEVLHRSIRTTCENGSDSPRSENASLVRINNSSDENHLRLRIKFHLLQTVFYVTQTAMAYLIMLIVMSFNTWLGLSVLTASILAYFIFGINTVTTPLVVPVRAEFPCLDCD